MSDSTELARFKNWTQNPDTLVCRFRLLLLNSSILGRGVALIGVESENAVPGSNSDQVHIVHFYPNLISFYLRVKLQSRPDL